MNLSPEILAQLESAPLFRGVSRPQLAKALTASRQVNLMAGDILLTPGQANAHIYLVLSGRLSLQAESSGMNPIAMYGECETVGETSMLDEGHSSAYIIAATDCRLLALDQASIWSLVDSSHEAAHNLLRILAQRVHVGDRRIAANHELQHGYTGPDLVDVLTGLYHRDWMLEKIQRFLQRGITNKKSGCLILLEMDGYQDFIDNHGELGGDQALRTIAHTMLSCLRPDDQAGHHADHQFSVFLPHTSSLTDARTAAERLRSAVSKACVVLPSGDVLPLVSISLGVSKARLDDTLEDLIARTEDALNFARENGENSLHCAP